jgi:hypothetical protein
MNHGRKSAASAFFNSLLAELIQIKAARPLVLCEPPPERNRYSGG